MELIYVWIEKYRNIEQCGFHLSRDFTVEVKNEDKEDKENKDIIIKSINIKKHIKYLNIYGNNISNVTAIVGKNSVGKSNFLSCIGELLTSFQESSFILIYYDKYKDNYIVECNQIAIKDDLGHIEYAIHRKIQPKTLILEFNNGKIIEVFDDNKILYDIEYITIKETLNEMMWPNANCVYSNISRFGLPYKRSGLLYQFVYLKDSSNNIENFKNNNIWINFEIIKEWQKWDEYKMKILPKNFLNEKFYYCNDFDKERYLYKKVYMLRFFERTLNAMRFPKDDVIKEEQLILKEVINKCEGDIDKLLQKYEVIKEKTIKIRTILMENNMENTIDIDICYKKFVELLEKIIIKIEEQNFMNSFKFNINVSSILKDEELSKYVYEFLELADSNDICLEFINNKIKIYYNNLSDGLKERFNLFSTIYKCFKQNNIGKYKNIILILDEPDVHMHPEWSRRLFNDILHFLEKEFHNLRFQIIFTTHSPFMLSDIPKENVIYLSKNTNGKLYINDNDINTFGSNIHMLLKHSFFMDLTMGEFANKKIKAVARDLSEKTKNKILSIDGRKEEIEYIIKNIGEPVIKRKLEDLYNKKFEHFEINNKIEELTNKVKKLEEIIKEKGL
ncbi:AAA family ATPase [Clostridium botulinum]|uniref:AAA family ATPase n=1 Tax=Clostridium botulinum TaxID=1491 RepID=UPI0007DFE277|nr:AAA family ATPase [Clostridium botulinum]KEJ01942.1 hypothetical protein N497_04180 [Clostridium botulinum F 357]